MTRYSGAEGGATLPSPCPPGYAGIARESVLFDQLLKLVRVNSVRNCLVEPRPDLGLFAIPYSLDEQVSKRAPRKLKLAQDIEYLAA